MNNTKPNSRQQLKDELGNLTPGQLIKFRRIYQAGAIDEGVPLGEIVDQIRDQDLQHAIQLVAESVKKNSGQ